MNTDKSTWTLWYSVEWLRDQVENITAAVASRKDKDGAIRSELMMTEDHDELFRRLMRDALNEIRSVMLSIVSPEHPSDEIEREKTIHLHLQLGGGCDKNTVPAVVRVLDDKVRQWLIARIIWGWFRLVCPDECTMYGNELEQLKSDIEGLAKREQWRGVRRRYLYY